MLSARSIARASAEKIELSIGRDFLGLLYLKTAVLLLSLEASVKTYRWSECDNLFY